MLGGLFGTTETAELRSRLTRLELKLDAILEHLEVDWRSQLSEVDRQILELLRQGEKLQAVKLYFGSDEAREGAAAGLRPMPLPDGSLVSRISRRVWPTEIDTNLHMNQAVYAEVLELGRIDFVPEYLGTLLRYTGAPDTESETESAREELLDRLAPRGLTALGASPAEDKNVIVVTVETAERLQLRTISDLGDEAGALRFGGPPECVERPLCLAGLESVYGLRFGEFVAQPSLDFTSESLRRGEIDVGLLFSTAIQLDDSNLVELDDDRALQPAENIVPIVRTDALARWHADVPTAVNRMSSVLTTNDLRALNREVAEGMAVTDVARGWLSAQGLLAPG